MLTDIFTELRAVQRLRQGPAGDYLDEFTDWLAAKGYTRCTIRSYVLAASRFMNWARQTGCATRELDEQRMHDYRVHLIATATQGSRQGERSNLYCGARRFVVFLRHKSLLSRPVSSEPVLVENFCRWMRQHRGVRETTLTHYRRVTTRLIEALGDDPAEYSAGKLRSFVLDRSKGYSRSQAETVVTSVRMLVRFLVATGQCAEGLTHAIPRVAGWRATSLPKYLRPEDIERAIAACNPTTPLGARDHAVILLLARLALRASDVANLECQDIDWTEAKLRVAGKNGRPTWLPLPQDVGDAVLHYLRHARPATKSDRVFIITTAPYTQMQPRQVSQTAQRVLVRAGIQTPSQGAHVFRHSAATSMLRRGASLEEIGALLRHSHIDTTAHYAKVDTDLLRQVALPWPQECSSC